MDGTDFTVGFDLDMTLIDSRPGIAATYQELSARTGVAIDALQELLERRTRAVAPAIPELEGSAPPADPDLEGVVS